MKTWIQVTLLAAALVATFRSHAATNVDALFKSVATFECGQDEKPLVETAEAVRRSMNDPDRRKRVEDGLIEVLKTGTVDARRFACRQLWMAASDRAVPALSALLVDESMTDTARFALERLRTPAAAEALRDCMAKVKGRALAGLVNSVGQRRDPQAVPLLTPLLNNPDDGIAAAAGWALGNIGGEDIARVLESSRSKAGGSLRRELDDAVLLCADRLTESGSRREAAVIYQRIYTQEKSVSLRVAALQGLAVASPEKAVAYALEALNSENPRMRAGAGGLIREMSGTAMTKLLADGLPALSSEGQVMMLGVLGYRRDAIALPAVRHAAENGEETVRIAAIQALGEIGTGEDVPLLIALCQHESSAVARESRACLGKIKHPGVDAVLAAALGESEPEAQVEILKILASRQAKSMAPAVMQFALVRDTAVRAAALDALAELGGDSQLAGLIDLLNSAADDRDRAMAAEAVKTIMDRTADKQADSQALITGLRAASASVRKYYLNLLPAAPTPETLRELLEAADTTDPATQTEAIRALSRWPDTSALDDLIKLARTRQGAQHVLAMRGCVHVLGLPSSRTMRQTLNHYDALLRCAQRTEEKRMIIAGIATLPTLDALALLQPHMADTELSREASMAVVKIAQGVGSADMGLAMRTLENMAQTSKSGSVQSAARDAIRSLDRNQGYVTLWMMAGPYTLGGNAGANLCDTVFDPERADARDVKWRQVSAAGGTMVDLRKAIGGDNRAAYLKAVVESATRQNVILELGSDDGIKAWLNGKVIHSNNASRSFRAGEDRIRVTLNAGRNVLLLKVINGGVDWAASARLVTLEGGKVEGLRMKVE